MKKQELENNIPEELPYELPDSWEWVRLDFIDKKSQNTSINPFDFPSEVFESYSVPIFDTGRPEFVSGSKIGSNKQLVEPDDVLICKINPRINRVWIVNAKMEFRQIASTEWIAISPISYIIPRFLMYACISPYFREILNSSVSGVGGSLQRARPAEVYGYPIPLPPFSEQQRIVAKLDAAMGRLRAVEAALEGVPEMLEQLRQSVLHWAVTGKLTEGWRKEHQMLVVSENMKQFKKEHEFEEFKIYGWIKTTIGELFEVVTGGTPSKSEPENYGDDFPFYKPTDLDKGYFVDESADMLSKIGISKSRILPENSVLVTSIGSTIGKTGLIRKAGASNQQINAIKPNDLVIPEYTYFFMSSPLTQKNILDNASTTTLPIINKTRFEELDFIIPPIEEQEIIIQKVERCFEQIFEIETSYKNALTLLSTLRHTLLTRAFHGELVEQDPADEPAEVLLKRIRAEKARLQETQKTERKKRQTGNRKSAAMQIGNKEIETILAESKNGPMKAADVWRQSKYKDDIDMFYKKLRELVERDGRVIQEVGSDQETYLSLKTS